MTSFGQFQAMAAAGALFKPPRGLPADMPTVAATHTRPPDDDYFDWDAWIATFEGEQD